MKEIPVLGVSFFLCYAEVMAQKKTDNKKVKLFCYQSNPLKT